MKLEVVVEYSTLILYNSVYSQNYSAMSERDDFGMKAFIHEFGELKVLRK